MYEQIWKITNKSVSDAVQPLSDMYVKPCYYSIMQSFYSNERCGNNTTKLNATIIFS